MGDPQLEVKAPIAYLKVMEFLKKLVQFIKDVAGDERIPARDKTVVLALLALVVSPFDIIPDWIPLLGVIDDAFIIAIVLDYFFNVLGETILLAHYPWGMKSFVWLKKVSWFITRLSPQWLKDKIWKYKPAPY